MRISGCKGTNDCDHADCYQYINKCAASNPDLHKIVISWASSKREEQTRMAWVHAVDQFLTCGPGAIVRSGVPHINIYLYHKRPPCYMLGGYPWRGRNEEQDHEQNNTDSLLLE